MYFSASEHDQDGKIAKFKMLKPDDGHQHARVGPTMEVVVPLIARRFHKALIMPNLVPPVTRTHNASSYREWILEKSEATFFEPIMTLYLTSTLNPEEVQAGLRSGQVRALKYYPRGLTTNSDDGLADPKELWTPGSRAFECLQVLAQEGGVLCLHGADGFDSAGDELDPYDQERHFIEHSLPQIMSAHPRLKISMEHLSTAWGVEFMRKYGGERLGCSLTGHHLVLDRRDVFRSGYNVHRSWMPAIQSSEHKEALRAFASEGHPFVWLGSDSAPHPRRKKEAACCASGVLTAHIGIELYIEAFETMNALDERFGQFACRNWRMFFLGESSLREIRPMVTYVRRPWKIHSIFVCSDLEEIIPFKAGETMTWAIDD